MPARWQDLDASSDDECSEYEEESCETGDCAAYAIIDKSPSTSFDVWSIPAIVPRSRPESRSPPPESTLASMESNKLASSSADASLADSTGAISEPELPVLQVPRSNPDGSTISQDPILDTSYTSTSTEVIDSVTNGSNIPFPAPSDAASTSQNPRRRIRRPTDRTDSRGFIWKCPLCAKQKAMERDGLIRHL